MVYNIAINSKEKARTPNKRFAVNLSRFAKDISNKFLMNSKPNTTLWTYTLSAFPLYTPNNIIEQTIAYFATK